MRTLVTGGAGAIGSWVIQELVSAGERPVCYDVVPGSAMLRGANGRFDFVRGDVTDLPTLVHTSRKEDIGAIIHCAFALGEAAENTPHRATMSNIEGMLNVLEAARVADAKRVVFSSSISAIGKLEPECGYPTYKPLTEGHECNPQGIYGVAKHTCELLGLEYQMKYGLDFLALRFTPLYGPGRGASHSTVNVVDRMVDAAVRGATFELETGSGFATEWTYNKDVARALVSALRAEAVKHRIFHAGSGAFVSLGEIAQMIGELFPGAAMRIGPGHEVPTANYAVRFDCSRAHEELGFRPKYDMRAGLRDYADFMKSREP